MLTQKQAREAKPSDKNYKLSDEKGLFLLVHKNGSKYWRMKYRYQGKEKTASYGVFPEVSIGEARNKRDNDRLLLRQGVNPVAGVRVITAKADSFEAVANEWLIKRGPKSDTGDQRLTSILEKDLYPFIGHLPLPEITPTVLIKTIERIQKRGAVETGRRANQFVGQILRYGIATERCDRDISQFIKDALQTPDRGHFSAITDPTQLSGLLKSIYGYSGSIQVQVALKLNPHIFCRPTELRHLTINEINWVDRRIEIPAEKMKMKADHIIPLSKQVHKILKDYVSLGIIRGDYVFPSQKTQARPISENAIRAALRSMGFGNDTQTSHGFRATARTMLDEQLGFAPHLIEHQLAHSVKDANGRAYNRTTHLVQRKKMMQSWSDYLDKLTGI